MMMRAGGARWHAERAHRPLHAAAAAAAATHAGLCCLLPSMMMIIIIDARLSYTQTTNTTHCHHTRSNKTGVAPRPRAAALAA